MRLMRRAGSLPQHDGTDPRACQACGNGRMGLKLGKFGAFIGCSNDPECRNTRPLAVTEGGADAPRNEVNWAMSPRAECR